LQILVIYAGTQGFLDPIPVSAVGRFEREVTDYFKTNHADLLQEIASGRKMSAEVQTKVKAGLQKFSERFDANAS
jgi:F-type H+-transporting ATPase subunit alpha